MQSDGKWTITVRQSKTDQEGRGHIRFVGTPTVAAMNRYQQAAGVTNGALFRRINKGGAVGDGLGVRSIRQIITRRAATADIDGWVSGHSLRVGAAQSLAAAGAGLVELQQAGDWKSPHMPAHYVRHLLAARGAVARLRYGVRPSQAWAPTLAELGAGCLSLGPLASLCRVMVRPGQTTWRHDGLLSLETTAGNAAHGVTGGMDAREPMPL